MPSRTCACVGAAFLDAFPAAVQSRHADSSIRTNACPSGLCAPSIPKLSGSTTGASQPSIVKCGVFANALDDGGAGPRAVPAVDEDDGVKDDDGDEVEDEFNEGDGDEDENDEVDESESEFEEGVGVEVETEEGTEVETTGTPDGLAAVPFVANSAARVRSASAINVLLPVRSSKR